MSNTSTCKSCGREVEFGQFPFCPHGEMYEVNAQRFDPIVVHRDAAGNIRYPGRTDAPVPPGFQKVELRTTHEVRAFQREVNQQENSKAEVAREKDHRSAEHARSQLRGELRMAMQQMTPFGRDFARLAMKKTDDRSRGKFDAGFRTVLE